MLVVRFLLGSCRSNAVGDVDRDEAGSAAEEFLEMTFDLIADAHRVGDVVAWLQHVVLVVLVDVV